MFHHFEIFLSSTLERCAISIGLSVPPTNNYCDVYQVLIYHQSRCCTKLPPQMCLKWSLQLRGKTWHRSTRGKKVTRCHHALINSNGLNIFSSLCFLLTKLRVHRIGYPHILYPLLRIENCLQEEGLSSFLLWTLSKAQLFYVLRHLVQEWGDPLWVLWVSTM